MKARALFISFVLTAAAFAVVQDEVKFNRTFKSGEKDKYTFRVQGKMPMGEMDITMSMLQEILKVHENGDADQKTTIADVKLLMNGSDMTQMVPPGAFGQPVTVRISKNGMPVDKKAAAQGPAGMGQLMSIGNSIAFDKPMKVGQTIPINQTDPKDPKSKVTGSMTLESITDGVAKILSTVEITTAQTTSKPMKIVSTSWIEVASAKPNKVEGTLTGMPEQGGMSFEDMKFSMERAK